LSLFQQKYDKLKDAKLILLISKGNEDAFNELYMRYSQHMYAYFYKMLYQDKELAADFTQTLFLKLYEKANFYNDQFAFSTWIYTMASNMCKNEYRRQSRSEPIIKIPLQLFDITEPKGPGNLDSEIFQKHLQVAINELEAIHRQCFVLRYQDELSIKEIAVIVDCPVGTVKSRLYYALKKLSDKLVDFKPNAQKKSNGKNV